MKLRLICGFATVCLMPALGHAQDSSGFNYTNIDLGFVDVEFDVGPLSVDGDGFSVAGSYTVADNFFIGGEYTDIDFDFGVDGEILEIGGGYFHPLNDELDFIATFSYVETEVSAGNLSVDDDGLGIGGGVRAGVGSGFEVDALLQYVNMDQGDSDTGIEVRGRYFFSDSLAAWAQTDFGSDIETFRLGIRFDF